MKHRRAQIIDALTELFEMLTEPSEFPVLVKTVQKRYVHWTTLDQQGAVPALLLTYGDNRRKYKGGEQRGVCLARRSRGVSSVCVDGSDERE